MKVFIAYQDIDSGAKVATEHIVENFKKMEPKIELVIYNQNPYKYSGFLSFTRNFVWSIKNFKQHIDAASEIDVIYSPYYLVKLSQFLSNKRKVPFYFHLHGDQSITQFEQAKIQKFTLKNFYTQTIHAIIVFLQRIAIQKAEKVFFVSKQAKQEFCQKNKIVLKNKKAVIVPNGVSLKKFFSIKKQEKLKIKKELFGKNAHTFVISYIGRIDHKKGILELIQSLDSLSLKEATLMIVYPNIPDKYSQKYLAVLKNSARKSSFNVIFKKNPKNIVHYYQASDLVILPSHQEMMPLVMLEAFACEIPFIGASVGNMASILNQISPDLILSKVNPQEIARKINWFLHLTTQQKKDITQKEKELARNFSWNKTAKKIFSNFIDSHFQY